MITEQNVSVDSAMSNPPFLSTLPPPGQLGAKAQAEPQVM